MSTGTSEVDAIPPAMPTVFIRPATTPACLPAIAVAVVQKEDSARYIAPRLMQSAMGSAIPTRRIYAPIPKPSKLPMVKTSHGRSKRKAASTCTLRRGYFAHSRIATFASNSTSPGSRRIITPNQTVGFPIATGRRSEPIIFWNW